MAHLVSTRFYFDYFLSLNFSFPSTPTTYFAQSWPLRDHLNLVPRTDTNTIASNDIGSNFFSLLDVSSTDVFVDVPMATHSSEVE